MATGENTSFGSALIAAVVSGVVSFVVATVSNWTAWRLHKGRLKTDLRLAENRAEADLTLVNKKFTLDRAFSAWKRRAEFAEEALSDFYKARDIINSARLTVIVYPPDNIRTPESWETRDDTNILNRYYAVLKRLKDSEETFAQLFSRRYRFMAFFGPDTTTCFDDLGALVRRIEATVQMLCETHRQRAGTPLAEQPHHWQEERRQSQAIIWDSGARDSVRAQLDGIVQAVEAICGPAIREIAE
jgi:hypothetical protein